MALAAVAAAVLAAPAQAHHRPAKDGCNTRACHKRVQVKHQQAVVRPHRHRLLRIASCESGRRWHIATGNGFYGGLQFTLSSWQAAGGRGMPHHATALEQMYRAVRLMRLQGWGAWPVCSRR